MSVLQAHKIIQQFRRRYFAIFMHFPDNILQLPRYLFVYCLAVFLAPLLSPCKDVIDFFGCLEVTFSPLSTDSATDEGAVQRADITAGDHSNSRRYTFWRGCRRR